MFKERLKELRASSGMFQSTLANALGLSQQTISKYESGEREPDLIRLQEIADFFNITTDYLLGRTNLTNYHNNLKIIASDWNIIEIKLIQACLDYIETENMLYINFLKEFCCNEKNGAFDKNTFLAFIENSSQQKKQILAHILFDIGIDSNDSLYYKYKLPIVTGLDIKGMEEYLSKINIDDSSRVNSISTCGNTDILPVPVLDSFISKDKLQDSIVSMDYIKSTLRDENRYFYLKITDSSMEQFNISSGCKILIDTSVNPTHQEIGLFKFTDESFKIRMLVIKDNYIILQSGNYNYSSDVFTKDDFDSGFICCAGKVIEIKIPL